MKKLIRKKHFIGFQIGTGAERASPNAKNINTMRKICVFLLLLAHPCSSFSKSCPVTYLLKELAERKGQSIFQVVSDSSGFIFVGEALWVKKTTIREKGDEEYLLSVQAKFKISEDIKGKLDSEVLVHSGSVENCGCGYGFEPGVEYLVIANKSKNKIVSYFCDFIGPKDRAMLKEFKEVNSEIRQIR